MLINIVLLLDDIFAVGENERCGEFGRHLITTGPREILGICVGILDVTTRETFGKKH